MKFIACLGAAALGIRMLVGCGAVVAAIGLSGLLHHLVEVPLQARLRSRRSAVPVSLEAR